MANLGNLEAVAEAYGIRPFLSGVSAGLGDGVDGALGPPPFPVHLHRLDEAALGQPGDGVVHRRLPAPEGAAVPPFPHERPHAGKLSLHPRWVRRLAHEDERKHHKTQTNL